MGYLRVASYVPGDEHKILELFKLVYNRDMTLDYWRWRFINNPAGSKMIHLCWDGTVLAGHYAVSPVTMVLNGKEHLTALSMTTMTHPGYRKKGIFVKLARSLYQQLAKEGISLIWGFPNNNSFHGFTAKLNWLPLAQIPKLVKYDYAAQKNEFIKYGNVMIVEVKQIDDKFDELWNRFIAANGKNMVVRNSKYLNWRYLENPLNNYKIFAVKSDSSIEGYVVLKFYYGSDAVSGEIVDILALDRTAFTYLINYAINYFSNHELDNVTLWMNTNLKCYEILKQVGFKITEDFTHIGAMINAPTITALEINDYSNWYVTMGDSDVY